MTRAFQEFLIHFSQEIEAAKSTSSGIDDSQRNEAIDKTVIQMMELAERVYPQEVSMLLQSTGVANRMAEIQARVELNSEHFSDFQLAEDWTHFQIIYCDCLFNRPVLHLEDAMSKYFSASPGSPEFYFLTAYLAKQDHFIAIQLFDLLESIRH